MLPEVKFTADIHRTDSKTVIEITITEGKDKPYLANHDNGRWLAYIRNKDQNLLANKVILNIWKLQKEENDLLVEFSDSEILLINYLKDNKYITLSRFKKLSGLNKHKAEWILAKLITIGVLDYNISEEGCKYLPSKG